MTMSPSQTELIEAYVDGRIAESQAENVVDLLRGNAEARAYLRSLATLESGLRDLAVSAPTAPKTGEAFSGIGFQPVIPPTQAENRCHTPDRTSMTRRVALAVTALAACFLLAVGWSMHQDSNPPKRTLIATLAKSSDAVWNGEPLTDGDQLQAQSLSLQSGIVRLEFIDGAEVTLHGPAEYELIAPGETRLHTGLLTATVPDGAEGFRIDTPSARVVDLGTVFGIEQSANGVSLVSVFDGEVEIVSRKDSHTHSLTEGKTAHLDADGSVTESEFSVEPFAKLWPTAAGITGSTGAFRFVPPWPRRLSRIQSDTEIFVLPEGYARELKQPCPIDQVELESSESNIPAGQRVRSFLLQFNPVDPTEQDATNSELGSRMRRIEGSITFDRPVIGLITSSPTLNVTDEVFGLRRGPIPPFKRGLELSNPRTADVVSLSEDRRTLTLKLAVFNQLSDHVRVIVDASLADFPDQ